MMWVTTTLGKASDVNSLYRFSSHLEFFLPFVSSLSILDGKYSSDKKEILCTDSASISNFTPLCSIDSNSNLRGGDQGFFVANGNA